MRPVAISTWMPAARAAAIAAIVRGRRTPSLAISVRSRSHAIAATRRGKSGGRIRSAGRVDDVLRDVGDFLLAQLVPERGHRAAAVA